MKTIALIVLLLVFSLPVLAQDSTITVLDHTMTCVEHGKMVPCFHAAPTPEPKKTAQSNSGPGLMVAMGGTLGATSAGSPFTDADTVAGGFIDGRASFGLLGLTVTGRMLTAVENGVRYAPGSTDAVLNFLPSMYMEIPLAENWGFLVGGVLDGQRAEGTTVMNPGMSFGVTHHTRDAQQVGTLTYLYDDILDNGVPKQFFRGYRGTFELQRWWGGIGFLGGADVDRQAQMGILTSVPRTQFKARFGIGFRPKPTN